MATGLYVQLSYKPKFGGAEEHTHQLVRHLNQLGEEMTVLTLGTGAKDEIEFDATCGYPVIRFQVPESSEARRAMDYLLKKPVLFWEVFSAIQRESPDYVVSNLLTSLVPATSIYLATRLAGIPHFGFFHHLPPGSRSSRMRVRILQYMCDMVLCVSNDTAQTVFACGAARHKVHTVYNGVDKDEIDVWRCVSRRDASVLPNPETTRNVPVLLTVSRLVEHKGIQRVIKAMPKILNEVPNAQYMVAGDGKYREDLMRLARQSSARDSIIFLGSVANAEKFECYERCSVFVMPSEQEGFGIVYLEANAFGKPVIGGDVMGVPEAITDGKTGLLVDPFDVDAIADAAIQLLRNSSEAGRLGENGRRRVEREFTWKASAEKFVAVTRPAL